MFDFLSCPSPAGTRAQRSQPDAPSLEPFCCFAAILHSSVIFQSSSSRLVRWWMEVVARFSTLSNAMARLSEARPWRGRMLVLGIAMLKEVFGALHISVTKLKIWNTLQASPKDARGSEFETGHCAYDADVARNLSHCGEYLRKPKVAITR